MPRKFRDMMTAAIEAKSRLPEQREQIERGFAPSLGKLALVEQQMPEEQFATDMPLDIPTEPERIAVGQ